MDGASRVYNYAIAKVRYRAVSTNASQVKVFFRLCTTAATGLQYNSGVYRHNGPGAATVPLLGHAGGELSSVPFFLSPRVKTVIGEPGATGMTSQPLENNYEVQTIVPTAGSEVAVYFGCWLDINEPTVKRFPVMPGAIDGPWPAASCQAIQQLFRSPHQCLVAEVYFEPDATTADDTPAGSDNLSQRNLVFLHADNPGAPGSHHVLHPFEIKPSVFQVPKGWNPGASAFENLGPAVRSFKRFGPDELLIRWNNLPLDSEVTLFFSDADTAEVQLMAAAFRRSSPAFEVVDNRTLKFRVANGTWMPIPGGRSLNIPVLLSVKLPDTIVAGQEFRVSIHQVSGTTRKVTGTFEINIPVTKAELMVNREIRILSLMKYIATTIPSTNRWYPIFQRYLNGLSIRVDALGGDSQTVHPNPDGSGLPYTPPIVLIAKPCREGWISSLLLALALLLVGLSPSVIFGIVLGALLLMLLAIVIGWWTRRCCRHNRCAVLEYLILGAIVALTVLVVLAFAGATAPLFAPTLVISALLVHSFNANQKMSGLINVMTLVRPIRKLFVIEDGDISTFARLVAFCSEDMNGIRTLILINDERLFSENTIALVHSHDPDVILNYSQASDQALYDCFRILVRRMNRSPRELRSYKTHLAMVQQYPAVLQNMFAYQGKDLKLDDTTYAVIRGDGKEKDDEDEDSALPSTPEELSFTINCGSVGGGFLKLREFGVFRDLKIAPPTTWQQLIAAVHADDLFIQLSTHFVGNGTLSSIWEIDHNLDQSFYDKRTVIIGSCNDLKSLTYFWNERASYERCKIVWLPAEAADAYMGLLSDFDHYCLFDSAADISPLQRVLATKTKVDGSVYYFPEMLFSDSFSATQVLQQSGPRIQLSHPAAKLFSRMSHYMFEVRGLAEVVWPVSAALGEMFISEHSKTGSHYFGSRISKSGFATSTGQFNVFEDEDLFVNLILPDKGAMFKEFFRDHQLELRETRGTKVIDRIISLVGGVYNLEVFAHQEIFELLVKLTPRRTERIIKELQKNTSSDLSGANLKSLLTNLPGLTAPRAVAADELEGVLLRGKSFSCPQCGGQLWFALENIKAENKCYRCDHPVTIPAYQDNRALADSFRVNELILNAVDQGVLPVLLTLYFLARQRFVAQKYIYDCEVAVEGESQCFGELDIIFTLGRIVGVGEVKADRGFETEQVDRLIEIAKKVRAGVLLFSTLKPRASNEVKTLFDYLKARQLSVPAIILPREALFVSQKLIDISKVFEVGKDNRFFSGPVVL